VATRAYADERHVYELGFDARAFVSSARSLAAVDVGASTFTLPGHGLRTDDAVTFSVEGDPIDGTPDPALPAPLSLSLAYYAIVVSGSLFKVAATAGGAAVTLTDAGAGTFGIVVDLVPRLRRRCLYWSAVLDQHLTAHDTPLEVDPETGEYPELASGLVARFAARDMIPAIGAQNPLYADAVKRTLDAEGFDKAMLIDLKAGKPLAGVIIDQTPAIATGGAVAVRLKPGGLYRDPNDEERV
jgi:hypothetical protein